LPAVGDHELAAERGSRIRVEQNRASVGATSAAGDVVLHHEEIQELIGRHDRGGAHVDQPPFHAREVGIRAKLVRVPDHLVTAEPTRDDGAQQPGGWLDG
jgi:hypothetical protein